MAKLLWQNLLGNAFLGNKTRYRDLEVNLGSRSSFNFLNNYTFLECAPIILTSGTGHISVIIEYKASGYSVCLLVNTIHLEMILY